VQVYTVAAEDGTKFKFQGLITVLTTLTYTLCAAIERSQKEESRRKAPLKSYVKLAMLTVGAHSDATPHFLMCNITQTGYLAGSATQSQRQCFSQTLGQ
jgi:hypothetical protein